MFRHVIETVTIIINALCWLHLYWTSKSIGKTLFFFIGAIFLGTLTEIAAIVMTGGYHYPGFWWYIGPVPLMIAIGWGSSFYVSYVLGDVISRSWNLGRWNLLAFAACAGAVGLILDFASDPVAVELEWWVWENGSAYFGVPVSNFVGWFVFCGGFALAHRWAASKDWGWLKKSAAYAAALVGVFIASAASAFPFF